MTEYAVTEVRRAPHWGWMLAALGAHTGWGAYPVFARYLQTVSHLPSMSLLALGNLVVLPVVALVLLPRIDRQILCRPILWLFAIIVILRAITNMLAARFTLSVYVQLITQMTPFVVVLLSVTFLREAIPPYTGRAMTLALAGAVLMMSGDISQQGLAFRLASDWLGIALASASTVVLALYMIVVRRTAQQAVPSEAVLIVQVLTLVCITGPLSLLLGEDWSRWRALGTVDWVVFFFFSVGVLLGANLIQIGALRHLGAPLVSSMMAWRLVAALLIAGFLLGERLTSLGQGMGALIVLVTITWYLSRQTRGEVAV